MNFPTLRQVSPTLVLASLIAVLGVEAAYAQTASFQPLNTAFSSVLAFMTGTFATTAATIAVVAAGSWRSPPAFPGPGASRSWLGSR